MQRNGKPTDLTLKLRTNDTTNRKSAPNNSPINVDLSSFGGEFGISSDGSSAQRQQQNNFASLPPPPSSPPLSPRHNGDSSRSFLSNLKSRKGAEQRDHIRQVREDNAEHRPGSSSMSKIYHLRKNGSTPELSLVGSADNVGKTAGDASSSSQSDRPHPSPHASEDSVSKRKEKPFRNPLTRNKSLRRDSHSKSRPETKHENDSTNDLPANTAPASDHWSASDDMRFLKAGKGEKEKRGKSAERVPVERNEESVLELRPATNRKKEKGESSGFMSGSKNVMSKATKGGGNFLTRLGKIGRSTSTNEKDIPDSEYVLKVINLPLVEQTRITRISKDLNSCRDKTEYWMPALPWRAIDYLNLNCESEGLYRVPGGHAQIKHWQRRFDTEFDIDLLDEKDLYDPNEIGSMLKKWLTDLPTEMMPVHLQSQLALALEKENPDFKLVGQAAPQKLRDALSELPPFNYYLLFAVTCHLSLLLSNKDKNKMDLHNLSVCIGPCLKLERWLFNYLVGDWRHCWQGCFTEKQYLEAEKAHEQGLTYQPHSTSGANSASNSTHNLVGGDERPVHSSGSSKPASRYDDTRSIHSQDHEPPRSRKESRKPETYRPAGSRENSGTHSRRSPLELPSDVEGRLFSEGKDVESATGGSSRPVVQRQYSHGRSKSDAATTPVTTTYGSDHPFPMPARQ